MQDYQHVNKYMIEFSKHATHTGWNDVALNSEFYRGLAERIKDQLVSMERPVTLQQLKTDALCCDSRYWERQGEKSNPTGRGRTSTFTTQSPKAGNTSTTSPDTPKPGRNAVASHLGPNGKLTDVERERHREKQLCYYCALSMDEPAPAAATQGTPNLLSLVAPPSPSQVNQGRPSKRSLRSPQ